MVREIRSLVSFVIPTLNRGRYVVRAVESCLTADRETAGVEVEVIVVDSQSDDGSWEALEARFDSDARVKLIQNRRGVGPTRSWLDGGKLAHGEFVTFVWSDDYISTRFLTALVPALRRGGSLAVGRGLIRDVDDESPLPSIPGGQEVELERFLAGYFASSPSDSVYRPVSPACSLFTRHAFETWMTTAEEWCRSTRLRQRVMWEKAIGPDLLLYLVALDQQQNAVQTVFDHTAQFSKHPGSITISSGPWILGTGYWLARLWFLSKELRDDTLSPDTFGRSLSGDFAQGITLAVSARKMAGLGSGVPAPTLAVTRELARLWSSARRHDAAITIAVNIARKITSRFAQIIRLGNRKSVLHDGT
jgi:glycosyltransferase involved in cell wall biosynthesis